MAEYHTVIARAVSELAANNPEARQDVYERARKTFDLVVQGRQPQITALEILHQQVALEDAIRKVEADALSPSPPAVHQKRSEEFTDQAAVSLPKTKTRRRLVLSWALTSAVWCTFVGEYAYQDYKIRHPPGTPIQQRCPDAVPDPIIDLTPWCLGSLPVCIPSIANAGSGLCDGRACAANCTIRFWRPTLLDASEIIPNGRDAHLGATISCWYWSRNRRQTVGLRCQTTMCAASSGGYLRPYGSPGGQMKREDPMQFLQSAGCREQSRA